MLDRVNGLSPAAALAVALAAVPVPVGGTSGIRAGGAARLKP